MTPKEREAVVADDVKKESVVRQEMQKITGDQDARYMGVAKDGGKWFKNHKTGTLYRIDIGTNGYELKETRKAQVVKEKTLKKRTKGDGPTRNELMLAVKAKKIANFRVMNKAELAEILKPDTTPSRIKEIQEIAVKRWQSGWKFNKKGK